MNEARTKHISWALILAAAIAASDGAPAGAVASNPRVERRVMQALTPAQAEAFAAGAAPEEIVLDTGETLAARITREGAEATAELAYTPLDPCVVVKTAGAAKGALGAGEVRAFVARGDLALQGGAAAGCGVPADARALAVILRASGVGAGSLRIWPTGEPEFGIAVLDYGTTSGSVPAILEVCHGDPCETDFKVHAVGARTHLRMAVVGYFAPAQTVGGPAGDPGPPGPRGEPGPPGTNGTNGTNGSNGINGTDGTDGTSCTVASAGDIATVSCTDGTSVSWAAPPPPGPVRSFEIESPEIQMLPGQQITFCYYFRTPNTEAVAIRRWVSDMPASAHDILLLQTATDLRPPGTLQVSGCSSSLIQSVVLYTARSPLAELALPGDDGTGKPLAMEIPAGTPGFLFMNFRNTTAETVTGHVTVRGEALAPGVPYTRTDTLVTYDGSIDIPPHAVGHVESHQCPVPAGAKFWSLSTRTHKQAVHTAVKDGPAIVFESSDWEHPGSRSFAPPGFFSFTTGQLTYECTYDNTGDNAGVHIRAGDSPGDDEVCMAISYFFPSTRGRFCVNDIAF